MVLKSHRRVPTDMPCPHAAPARGRSAACCVRWPSAPGWRWCARPSRPLPLPSRHFRGFNESHCLTIVDFSGTGIQEKGIASAETFVNNALDRKPPMRNIEQDQVTDLTQPLSIALEILAIVLDFFG